MNSSFSLKSARRIFATLAFVATGLAAGAFPTSRACAAIDALAFAPLYAFTGGADGGLPYGGLVQANDGSLYGTAYFGGNSDNGTIFKIAPDGTFSVLHAFSAFAATSQTNPDGARPYSAPVIGADGALYGTTSQGGTGGAGTVYKVTTDGTFTSLASFDRASQGAASHAALLFDGDDSFYGTTNSGGTTGGGTIFNITAEGTMTVLASLPSTVGTNPETALVELNGIFYGTAFAGGANRSGCVFQMTADGTVSVLYPFSALANGVNTDGADPYGGLAVGDDGNLYGTTYAGGAYGQGTIFEVSPSGDFHTLLTFDGTNGAHPYGTLIKATDGNFYGTTYVGTSGSGNVFSITPGGVFTQLAQFDGSTAGAAPYSGLIQGLSGAFYATATSAGTNGYGAVDQLIPVPLVTVAVTTPSVTNGSGTDAVFTLTLSAAWPTDIVVSYAVKGSGINGTDYQFLKGTAKIKAGKTSKPIRVIPMGDLGGAASKTVKLTLEPGGGYAVGTTAVVKAKILAAP